MGASVADLFIVLDSVTDPFSAGMRRAAADAEAQSKRMSGALGAVTKVGLGVGIAVGGIAVASVKAASDFQQQMTRLSTAAGAPKAAVAAATGEILKMGTQVGMTGTQMAEALYHPVSAGLDMATSLQVVKYAAEEAQISGAKLDDTTYSLSSVMKAFNFPASQAAQTMATLNAVVGDGDMRFQDFNASIKNWAPTAAQMGMSVSSMGAGLAYLTDRGNSAEEASTRLTMGISMMATPSKQAAALLEGLGVASSDVKGSSAAMTEVLKKAGITQNQLAADLARPDGLYVALKQLQDALHKAGVRGTEADSAIAKIFGGGRSDKAILSLLQNLDGLKLKYDQITADSTNAKFQANWESTKNTFSFQMQQMKVAAQNFGIEIGTKLLPVLSNLISTGESDLGQLASGFSGPVHSPVNPGAGNAFLNKDLTPAPPKLTGWEEFGEKLHQYLTDIENDAKRLEPVGHDVMAFAEDAYQGLTKILPVALSVAGTLGKGLFLGAEAAGTVLRDVLGPAIRGVGDFIDAHQTAFKIFADVVLGGIALKMGVLGTINATKGLIDLATKIMQFPMGQVNQITTAFGDLKTSASGALDKILPDSGKLAGLAKVGQDLGGVEHGISGVEKAAADAEQLSLFETNLKGIVQVADHEQLALFGTDIGNVGAEAETAEKSVGRFSGVMGKLTLAGGMAGVLLGVGLLADQFGKFLGVGDHTAISMDALNQSLQLAGSGSLQARAQFTQTAVTLVEMSNAAGKMGMGDLQGLKDIDTSLTQLVTSGHAQQARDQFNDIAAALAKQGISAQEAAAKFPGYEQAIKNAGDAAQTMDGKIQDSLNAMQRQQGLNQFNTDLGNLQQQLKDSGNALSGTSAAANNNQQAFQSLAQEMSSFYQSERNSGVGAYEATADYQNQYIALENLAIATMGSKAAADKFLGSLNLIKPNYDTTITLNVGKAYQQLNDLIQAIDSSVGYVQITGTSGGQSAGGKAYVYDNGGFVPGPTGAAHVAIVHGGEYVVSNEMRAGRQPIDPRVLSGMVGGRSSYAGGGGSGGGATVVNNYVVNFAGSLMTEDEALRKLRTAQLQWSTHNGGTGWSVP